MLVSLDSGKFHYADPFDWSVQLHHNVCWSLVYYDDRGLCRYLRHLVTNSLQFALPPSENSQLNLGIYSGEQQILILHSFTPANCPSPGVMLQYYTDKPR